MFLISLQTAKNTFQWPKNFFQIETVCKGKRINICFFLFFLARNLLLRWIAFICLLTFFDNFFLIIQCRRRIQSKKKRQKVKAKKKWRGTVNEMSTIYSFKFTLNGFFFVCTLASVNFKCLLPLKIFYICIYKTVDVCVSVYQSVCPSV